MEFLPKSFERYSAAMRVYLQNRYLKEGEKHFPFRFLRRVLIFEILTSPMQSTPTALADFCDNVVSSAQIELLKKGNFFGCTLKGESSANIDRRAVTAILCECAVICAKNKTTLRIVINKNRLCMIFHGDRPSGILSRLLVYMHAVHFYIEKGQTNAIYIDFEKAESKPLPHKKIWHYISDPISPIKAYLER